MVEVEAKTHPAEPVRFAALEKLCELDELAVSAAEAEALKEALRWLRIIYTTMTTPNSINALPSAAFSWPVRVPEIYIAMVMQRHAAALVLLSHFCLLLNRMQDSGGSVVRVGRCCKGSIRRLGRSGNRGLFGRYRI